MKKVFFIVVGALIVGGCSPAEPTSVEAIIVQEEETPIVVATKKLTMEIGGMSCEMGCGGAIRKELLATGAVERVKFDFKMGRDLNTAEIFYDASKISDEEITTKILELNDQQFSVGKESISNYESENNQLSLDSGRSKGGTSESSFSPMEPIKIKKQNLIDLLLSTLMRR